MDDARNVSQAGQDNVDEQIRTAASLKEDADGWQDDGKDDLDDVAAKRDVSA